MERPEASPAPTPDDDDPPFDLVALARGEGAEDEAQAPDATLGGYMERHDRPAAFEGADGQPYTVDIAVEPADDDEHGYTAYFVFLRWAETGAGIMGHLDSADVAHGTTEDEARQRALGRSLHDVKAALDDAILRRSEYDAP